MSRYQIVVYYKGNTYVVKGYIKPVVPCSYNALILLYLSAHSHTAYFVAEEVTVITGEYHPDDLILADMDEEHPPRKVDEIFCKETELGKAIEDQFFETMEWSVRLRKLEQE